MWRNFFTVALRNISKNKVFTLINVSGLAIGLASSMLIMLFIIREVSFDRFHENRQRIYRLYIDGTIGPQSFRGAWTSMLMAETFAEEIPEIDKFVRFDVIPQRLIWSDGEKHIEDHFLFADSSLSDVFTLKYIRGDPSTALTLSHSIVITEEKARLYFGDRDPLGQLLVVDDEKNMYRVTGVIEALPENSHFFADFIASMSTLDWKENALWFQNSKFSYVLLKKGSDPEQVEKLMAKVLDKHIRPELRSTLGVDPEEWAAGGNRYGVYLQPLLRIHLQPDIEVGMDSCFRPVNDRIYIYIFGLVAFFILVIASINFMNLSTARASTRGREIGLRITAGSNRSLLVNQFLTESVILSFIGLAIALILVELTLPWFNHAMDLNLRLESMKYTYFLPLVVLLTLLVGLISGAYPAFYLSRYKPVEGIKGAKRGKRGEGMLRQILVIAQFTISVGIIVATLIVSHQLKYMLEKDLGYDKEQVVVLQRTFPLNTGVKAFCREVEKIPGVVSASSSTTFLGFDNTTESYMIQGREASQNFLFATNYVDYDFMKTYNFRLAGSLSRFFDRDIPSDSSAIVINRSAVEEFHIDDPYSAVILETSTEGDTTRLHVIGVLEDFHHGSLREAVGPYMMRYKKENFEYRTQLISLRLGVAGKGVSIALNQVKEIWMEMTGEAPFQFFFLDEELDNYYNEERRTGRISLLFAILTTFIACMGLFGLTLHNTRRRTREIGIRKAMGATIGEVMLEVSREILWLMSISVLLAWRAARTNPAKVLHYE